MTTEELKQNILEDMIAEYKNKGTVRCAGVYAQYFINNYDKTCESHTNGTEYVFINKLKTGLSESKIKRAITALKINKQYEVKEPTDMSGFIFDPEQIVETRSFASHLINDDTFAYGMLLPAMEDIHDKKGQVVGREQKWKGVIITSQGEIYPATKWKESELKIRYDTVPEEMVLRWDLRSIEKYKDGLSEKVSGSELFEEIRAQFEFYNYYREQTWYAVNALWSLGTYLHQLFPAYPLKEERGLPGTGKTKTMAVSCRIALNATDIMVNPSEATLFRETEATHPSKFLDEAEKLFRMTKTGPEADNRVELINASYSRNGVVPRQEKIGHVFITKWYHVYSPTCISSINGLYGATETRAITQIHTRSPDADQRGSRDPEDDNNEETFQKIRDNAYLWSLQNWREVREAYKSLDTGTALRSRDLQLWRPLLAIAKVVDPEIMKNVLKFAEKLSNQRKIDTIPRGSYTHQLLESVKALLPADKDRIYLNDVRQKLDQLYPLDPDRFGAQRVRKSSHNKSIASVLDSFFKDLKDDDRVGTFYVLSLSTFEQIVTPLTNDFSPHSPHSSHDDERQDKLGGESEKNVENRCGESGQSGESGGEYENDQ